MGSQEPHNAIDLTGSTAKHAVEKGKIKLMQLSKKLKKGPDPVVMEDLAPDAPVVNCPPSYEGFLSMKPYKRRRISVAKRYCARLSRGMLKLTSGKTQKQSYEFLSSEYTIDLATVTVKIDDTHRKLIIVLRSDAHQLTPSNRTEYERWKEQIRKHRLFRQSFKRFRKDEAESEPLEGQNGTEPKMAAAQETHSTPFAGVVISNPNIGKPNGETEPPELASVLEECRTANNANTDLYDKLNKLFSEVKLMTSEMKEFHLEFKTMMKAVPSIAKLAMVDYLKSLSEASKNQRIHTGSKSKETSKDSDSDSSEEDSDSERNTENGREGFVETLLGAIVKQEKEKDDKEKELKKKEDKLKDEPGEKGKVEKEHEDEKARVARKKDSKEVTIELPSDSRTATDTLLTIPTASLLSGAVTSEVHRKTVKQEEKKGEKQKDDIKSDEKKDKGKDAKLEDKKSENAKDVKSDDKKSDRARETKMEDKKLEKGKDTTSDEKKPAKGKDTKSDERSERSKKICKSKLSDEAIVVQKTASSSSLAEKKVAEEAGVKLSLTSLSQRKHRDRLPREAILAEELGLKTLLQIAAKRIPIPISYFEPLSMTQALCEELRYADQTLNKAAQSNDALERQALVTAFAVSGYSAGVTRKQKPFNPLLGETFDFVSDSGWRYHAEQVGHHPPVLAAHADGPGWTWWQTVASSTKISWTGTAEVTMELFVRLRIGKDDFSWNKVKIIFENASAVPDKRKLKMHGTMLVKCSNGLSSSVVFNKDKKCEISGSLFNKAGSAVSRLSGSWDRWLKRSDGTSLFETAPLSKDWHKYYGFSSFACGLNELMVEERSLLPATDSRLRMDVRALELGDTQKATAFKTQYEKVQRCHSEQKHKQLWFEQQQDAMTYTTMWVSNGKYWAAKGKQFKEVTNILPLFKM